MWQVDRLCAKLHEKNYRSFLLHIDFNVIYVHHPNEAVANLEASHNNF